MLRKMRVAMGISALQGIIRLAVLLLVSIGESYDRMPHIYPHLPLYTGRVVYFLRALLLFLLMSGGLLHYCCYSYRTVQGLTINP